MVATVLVDQECPILHLLEERRVRDDIEGDLAGAALAHLLEDVVAQLREQSGQGSEVAAGDEHLEDAKILPDPENTPDALTPPPRIPYIGCLLHGDRLEIGRRS